MMKYEIEWELHNKHGLENNGIDIVEGKSEKDAVKNWFFFRSNNIIHKSFMDDWEGYRFKIANIRKAVLVKPRPKDIMKKEQKRK